MKVKYVKLKDVENLMKLIDTRDMYHDWSEPYKEYQKEIDLQFKFIQANAIEMEEI